MKVALVMPPIFNPFHPPVGIVALKSHLERIGHETTCIDLNTHPAIVELIRDGIPSCDDADIIARSLSLVLADDVGDELKEIGKRIGAASPLPARAIPEPADVLGLLCRVEEVLDACAAGLTSGGYDVVGCSSFVTTNACALYLLREVKRRRPEIVTVLGGPTASAEAESVESNCPYVDFIVAGHGELPLAELLSSGCRSSRRTLRASKQHVRAAGLGSYPILDYSDFDLSRYASDELGITAQNGCAYACRFCEWQSHFEFVDRRGAESVWREMEHLNQRFGVTRFHICSAQINAVATELAERVAASGLQLSWYGPANVDSQFAGARAHLYQLGGLDGPRFGVESGSDAVLALMRKPHRRRDVLPTISALDRHGIKTHVMFIAGFPGETEADHAQTCSLLEELLQNTDRAVPVSFPFFLNPHANGGLDWFEQRHGPVVKLPLLSRPLFSYDYAWMLGGLPHQREVIARRHEEHLAIMACHRAESRALA
jgi:Radical SAM superfamily/B12 binding domain